MKKLILILPLRLVNVIKCAVTLVIVHFHIIKNKAK